MLPAAIIFVVSLGLAALLSAVEVSVFSISEPRLRRLVDDGFRAAPALLGLRSRPARLLSMLRLGTMLAQAVAISAAGFYSYQQWGTRGAIAGVALATLLLVVFSELLPIVWGSQSGLRLAAGAAPLLRLLVRVFGPLLLPIERFAPGRGLEALYAPVPGDEEMRQLTALGHTDGIIEAHEQQIIERAFRMDETRAWDIMTPRVDVFAWRATLTLADISSQLRTVSFSRVPVYEETIDEITGVLYLRDAYQALVSGQRDVELRALAREPLIVPGSVSLTKLLRDFQTRRIHLAIVVDEYGGTDGLVTLEDVLEELVGEIVDETDVAEETIVRLSRNEILAAGDADLREINHFFNVSFPQLEHRSLNGYLLEELGRVPEPGEGVERDGIAIEVLDATETQVVRARLKRILAPSEVADTRRGVAGSAFPPAATAGGEAPAGASSGREDRGAADQA